MEYYSLNSSEIIELYNNGSAAYPTILNYLTLDFNKTPIEDIGINSLPHTELFYFNASSSEELITCKLYQDTDLINTTLYNVTLSGYNNISQTFIDDNITGLYNYTLTCNHSSYDTEELKNIYIFVDTVQPYINITSPLIDNTSYLFINESIDINATFTDDNLYNASVTVFNSTGDVMYSNSSNNLTGLSSWMFNGIYTPPYSGLYTISFKGTDGHTKKNINFDKWGVTKNSGSIDFGNCRIYTNVNENQISDYDYSCKDDRCIWTFDFSRKVSNLRQYIQCEQPITYLPDSGYPGHLISGINWIDSDNDNGLEVKVSKINDHTYAYDYIGQIDKITTRSIGELNINEKNVTFDVYDYDSSEAIVFDIDAFTLSNPSYILVENYTFEVLSDRNIDFFGDGNVYKVFHPATTSVYLAINISGEGDYVNEQISSVGWNDYRSFSVPRFHETFTPGNYSIEVYMRETSSGSIGLTNFSIYGITDETQTGNIRNHTLYNYIGNLSTTSFTNLGFILVNHSNIIAKSTVEIDMKYLNFGTSGVVKECYLESNNTGEQSIHSFRSNDGGTETGSSSLTWLFNSSNEITHRIGLWCKNDQAVNVEYRITGAAFPESFNSHLVVNSFQGYSDTVINFTSGRHLLISESMESKQSISTGMTTAAYIKSLSGGQTISMWTNSSRCPELKRHDRSMDVTGEIGTIKYSTICDNVVIGENTTYYTWLDIEDEESVSVLGSIISGTEFDAMNTSEVQLSPIVGFFSSPLDGFNYSGDVNISWLPFSDPNGDPVTYWLNATVDNGTIEILSNFSGTETSYTFNDNLDEEITLILIGCDDTGLCSATEEVTFINNDTIGTTQIIYSPVSIYYGKTNITIQWGYLDNNPDTALLEIRTPSNLSLFVSSDHNGTLSLSPSNITELGTYWIKLTGIDLQSDEIYVIESFCVTTEPLFKTGVCPIQDTPTILLFALLFGFACFLIVMAWVMKIGAMAFFGGLIILISTWFLVACSGILALIIGGFAIYIIAWSFLGISPT